MTGDPVQSEHADGGYGNDNGKKHNGDEPGGSVSCFWGGLSDSKGIDEDIREIE